MRYFLVIVLAVACSRQAESRWIDADRYLGEPIHVGALTVWPIHSATAPVVEDFLTLREAKDRNLATVREVSEEGEVRSLVVANRADLPILVCAGTVVRGGKQDRQIAQDFVIDARSEITVDAFCVERARWSGGGEFSVVQQYAITSARASAQYEQDQDGVWEDVAGLRTTLRNPGAVTIRFNSTSSLVDALEADFDDAMQAKVKVHFAAQSPAPIGFAYAIDGRPVSVRTFAHSRLLAQRLDGFVGTMCLEAALATGRRRGIGSDVVAFVKAISAGREKVVATRGANENGYRENEAGWNASCYVRRGDERVKLSEDWTAKP